jgi:SOS response regulatory protein OraA/RecX
VQKKFEKNLVDEILKSYFLREGESLLDENYLRKKIILFKEKGKSKNYIKMKLIEREEDKDLIYSLLEEIFREEEGEIIQKEYEKLKGKFEKQKIIEKLLRKGFLYDEVKKIIGE